MSRYPVRNSRVGCPLRGSVDVDECFGCAHFRSVAGAGTAMAVRCNPPWTRTETERQVFVGGMVVKW